MRGRLTTRCCSAIALTVLCSCALLAKAKTPPPSFFPSRVLWTLALNSGLSVPPVYDNGIAFFGLDGDRVVAYDLATGSQMWLVTARPQSQPAAGGDLLFLAETETITALRETDGTVAWQLPFSERLAAPLVWDNGWLIAADTTGGLTAFRAVDGHQIWRRDLGIQVHARPALAADLVYAPCDDGRLVALRVATGAPVWEHRLGGPVSSILAFEDRIFAGSVDNFFYAINPQNGAIIWRWQTGDDVLGPIAFDDSRVYFVSLDNILRGMSRRTGAQLWKRALPMRPTAGPVLVDTTLLVPGREPTLHAFGSKDGVPGNDIKADATIAAPPAFVKVPSTSDWLLIYVTTDLTNSATVTASTHSIDPPVSETLAPLPNVIKP